MQKLRLSIEELIVEARLKGIADISELQYAILEDNGKLSVFKKDENSGTDKGIAHVVISDGQINEKGLITVGLTKKALMGRLKKKKITLQEVFLYTVDDAGGEFIIRKEDLI
jgi:uncharacterized membrane protein YcaP (DUF421 family)